MKKASKSQSPGQPHECVPQGEMFSATGSENTQAPVCTYGIPLNVDIPRPGMLCPWLNKGRKFFYAMIRKDELIQLPVKGAKKGPGDVFGPSVCDAKFGCICLWRPVLEDLRKQRRGGKR
jgi:hypothetical protein